MIYKLPKYLIQQILQQIEAQQYEILHDFKFQLKIVFEEQYRLQIDDIINKIQNFKIIYIANNERDKAQNAKLMQDYLKPIHDIVDCKAVVNTEDGLDQWGMKQRGL